MKNLFYIFCICISVSVIFSCKKEEINLQTNFTFNSTELVPDTLTPMVFNCGSDPIQLHIGGVYQYSNARFNPNNSNEIAYIRQKNNSNTERNRLYTFNFETGETRKLSDKEIRYFDWSINDDISFITQERELWVMKLNGSELRKIEANDISYVNKWNEDGTQLLIDSIPNSLFDKQYKKIIDINGQVLTRIDSLILNPFRYADWQGSNLLFNQFNSNHFYNLDRDETKIINIVTTPSIKDVKFSKNGSITWIMHRMLKRKNLSTSEEELIKSYNNRISFSRLDISHDFRTILLSGSLYTMTSDCSHQIENLLFLLNSDGTLLRRILIPE